MPTWTGWERIDIEVLPADLKRDRDSSWRQGLHLGDILHRMKIAAGEKVGEIPGDQPLARLQEGFLFEVALEYMQGGMKMDEAIDLAFKRYLIELRKGITQQIMVEKDGVKMTPDGFNHAKGELESYKCTRRTLSDAKSLDLFQDNFWAWFCQEKAYLYALGCDTVTWFVMWAAGDYGKGKGSGPEILKTTVTFTPEELVSNWQLMLRHAEGMK